MQQLIAIAIGGAVGAITRFLVANFIYGFLGRSFPIGTLFINVSGSFLMGFLTELLLQRFALAIELRAGILVGFLGAYTTFSTFALETLYLFEAGNLITAFLNVFLSTVFCVAACWFGLVLGRSLFGDNLDTWLMPALPYVNLLYILLITFFTSILAKFLMHRFNFSIEWQTTTFVLLLGLATIAATLSFVFKLADFSLEFHTLLCLFVINALFGVTMVWLGALVGNWLWLLKLSQ
jgi:CrcB protein